MRIIKTFPIIITIVSISFGFFGGIIPSTSLLVEPNYYTIAVSVNDIWIMQYTNITILNPDGTYSKQGILHDELGKAFNIQEGDELRFTIIDINSTHIELTQEFFLLNGSIFSSPEHLFQSLDDLQITNTIMTSNITLIEESMSRSTIQYWAYDNDFIEFKNSTAFYGSTFEIQSVYDRQTGWLTNISQCTLNSTHTLGYIELKTDIYAPELTILSPENITYGSNTISLEFYANEPLDWTGYSLNGETNATIDTNSTLSLSDGNYNIIICANDSKGNIGSSEIVWFSIDTVDPILSLNSPLNATYNDNFIWLNFSISESPSWTGYSLDEAQNITITGNTLIGPLSEGIHSMTLYTEDFVHNTDSITIGFSIDKTGPEITITSPQNSSQHSTQTLWVNITLSEIPSWVGYSLDGDPFVPVSGNFLLEDLSEGTHSIVLYALDTLGNIGSSSAHLFTIDTTSPIVTITKPMNSTYNLDNFWLNFSCNEPSSWIGYSIDAGENITITGNISLQNLSEGPHSVVIYINDILGNMGRSNIVWFTIDDQAPVISISNPLNMTYSSENIWLNFTLDELSSGVMYSLDGMVNITITQNVLLENLSEGIHCVVIYANDSVNNYGVSTTVWFTIELPPPVTNTTTTSTTTSRTTIQSTSSEITTTTQIIPGFLLVNNLVALIIVINKYRLKKIKKDL